MSPSVSVRLLLTQSDERLVDYARAGHERAFEALVQRYRRQLHAYCRRLLLSDERAEDALQQALLQAWVALRDGAEVHDMRPWLYRIVHNAAVNALRVSGYDYCTLSESLSGADAPQADLDRRIAVREALAGLAALPEMQREALLRTAVEGRSHQQVASDLGVSEPALRGLVYRARAALRAAAGAIVPPPLIGWALEAGTRGTPALERVAGLGAGGGSAGTGGPARKGGAVAVTAGALAGGMVRTAMPSRAPSTRLTRQHTPRTPPRPAPRPRRIVRPAASTRQWTSETVATAPLRRRRRSELAGLASIRPPRADPPPDTRRRSRPPARNRTPPTATMRQPGRRYRLERARHTRRRRPVDRARTAARDEPLERLRSASGRSGTNTRLGDGTQHDGGSGAATGGPNSGKVGAGRLERRPASRAASG